MAIIQYLGTMGSGMSYAVEEVLYHVRVDVYSWLRAENPHCPFYAVFENRADAEEALARALDSVDTNLWTFYKEIQCPETGNHIELIDCGF